MSRIVGIDLGTTNSVVAVLEGGRPAVIPNPEGSKTTPSVIFFDPAGEVIVGELAKRQRVIAPQRTVYSVKRFMGCRWDEAKERTEGIVYPLESDNDGMVTIRIGEKRLRPEQISAHVLAKIKASAEAYLGTDVNEAVVTVPAYFNDSQRLATKIAGEIAGLRIGRIVNEPTAAALAYGLNKKGERLKVAVFDFGGGTFDISILELDGDIIEVKATNGDTFLGGDNINHLLTNWIIQKIKEETGIDPLGDSQAVQRIVEASENVKCELSTLKKTFITLPFIVSDETGPKHFNGEIAREEFEIMIGPILERLRPPCEMALRDARLRVKDLSAVLLVGGSTRIPAVRDLVKAIFGRDPDSSMNPDEVVAQGAAIQAAVMTGDISEVLLLDVTPLSLGIELAGDVFSTIIPRNSNVPVTSSKRFTTVVDNQSTVRIHVLQGERLIASENRSLGHFKLVGIPPAPKEIPEIEVSFHINADGILTVTAKDVTSGREQRVEMESYIPGQKESQEIISQAAEKIDVDQLHLQKAEVKRRIQVLEAQFDDFMDRTNAYEVINVELEQRMREAIFHWEVVISGDNWDMVEEAERSAQSLLTEVSALFQMFKGGAGGGAGIEMLPGESKKTDGAE